MENKNNTGILHGHFYTSARWGRIRPTESGHPRDSDLKSESRRQFLGLGDHVTRGFKWISPPVRTNK